MTSSKPRGDAVTDTQAELDRLRKLRRDVAAGLLEVSESAKRDAEILLAADQVSDTPGHETESDRIEPGAAQPAGAENARLYGIFGVGLACGFVVALLFTSSGDESPASVNADAVEPTGRTAAAPVAAEPVEPTPPPPPTTGTSTRHAARAGRCRHPAGSLRGSWSSGSGQAGRAGSAPSWMATALRWSVFSRLMTRSCSRPWNKPS